MDNRPPTFFLDIDGVLLLHKADVCSQCTSKPEVLPGVLDKLREWDRLGAHIILTTGRREGQRQETLKQLNEVGIIFDQLVMNCSGGKRVLINDCKPNSAEPTAVAIIVERNKGLKDIDV